MLILEKVSVDELVLWCGSNRGAFVLCALVSHLERGNAGHFTLASVLRDTISSSVEKAAASSPLKGQQALAKQLDKYLSENDTS